MHWRLDHVQLAMPPDGESAARRFYVEILGLDEAPKPAALAARGGAWFTADGLELHLGVEEDFRAARKAHPGIAVDDLDRLAERLAARDVAVHWDDLLPGRRRFYAADPFGNRLEFLGPEAG